MSERRSAGQPVKTPATPDDLNCRRGGSPSPFLRVLPLQAGPGLLSPTPPRHPRPAAGQFRPLQAALSCLYWYLECAFGKFPGFFHPVFFVLCPFRDGRLGKRFIATTGDDGKGKPSRREKTRGVHGSEHPSEPSPARDGQLLPAWRQGRGKWSSGRGVGEGGNETKRLVTTFSGTFSFRSALLLTIGGDV